MELMNVVSSNINHDKENECYSCSSSSCVSESNAALTLSFNSFVEPSFRDRLASCFLNNNLTHVQCNSLLSLLRSHSCFSALPKDARTLLNTPRKCVSVSTVEPGEYIHFDVESEIIKNLSHVSLTSINVLELDFNTDGCALDRSGCIHIWPIQCRIVNIEKMKPIVIGIYKGVHKPKNSNIFFEKFTMDIRRIISNGGIELYGNKIPVRLRSFIADAPARAFILNHRGHTSGHPCSKCKVSGIQYEGRYIFNGVGHCSRTDEEYNRCVDQDHHKEDNSPLSLLPIGMVSQVPFEYMHLVCLGVMKKVLSAWVYGKYSRLSKLSSSNISRISERFFKNIVPPNLQDVLDLLMHALNLKQRNIVNFYFIQVRLSYTVY